MDRFSRLILNASVLLEDEAKKELTGMDRDGQDKRRLERAAFALSGPMHSPLQPLKPD